MKLILYDIYKEFETQTHQTKYIYRWWKVSKNLEIGHDHWEVLKDKGKESGHPNTKASQGEAHLS